MVLNILIVDDSENVRLTVAAMIKRLFDNTIQSASTGAEACALLDRIEPDVAIIDLLMPDMDGLELIAAIRRTGRPIAIVAMTGGGMRADYRFLPIAEQFGADVLLKKPFSAERLGDAVQDALNASRRAEIRKAGDAAGS